ncbi:MAG TPA: 50S ribosomal protein L32 [Actinomycetes bacterium]
MAVPKRRVSRSNSRSRHAHWKAARPALVTCERCRERRLQHQACPTCGTYNRRQVLEV